MRLTRRIAIVALSAAMALSMLTACGGGENPSTGGGNGTGTGTGTSTGNGSGEENGGSTSSGTGTGKDDGTNVDPSILTSRTAKYFARKGVTGKNRYIRYYDRNENLEYTEACDGRRKYRQSWFYRNENPDVKFPYMFLYDVKTQMQYEYCTYNGNKEINIFSNVVSDDKVKNVYLLPDDTDMKNYGVKVVDPVTVDGVAYYCEQPYYSDIYYCFAMDDTEGLNLAYAVKMDWNGTEIKNIYEIREVSNHFDPALLRIPEGYSIIGKYPEVTGKDSYPDD